MYRLELKALLYSFGCPNRACHRALQAWGQAIGLSPRMHLVYFERRAVQRLPLNPNKRMQAFISYSVNDAILADAVYGYLKVNKIDAVKAPDDIPPGADWAASIAQLIEDSDYFVLLWTHHSMASKEVSKELTLAMDYGARIIPFRAEDLSPAGAWRYHLMNVQWLEAHSMPEASALQALANYFTKAQPVKDERSDCLDRIASADDLKHSPFMPEQVIIEPGLDRNSHCEHIQTAEYTANSEGIASPNLNANADLSADANTSTATPSSDISSGHANNISASMFSIAVEVGKSLHGNIVNNASPKCSSRGLLGYQLRDNLGRSIARVPWEMIESRSRITPEAFLVDDSINANDVSQAKRPNGLFFSAAIEVAKTMGNTRLETAFEGKSSKGYFNYSIRDLSGRIVAEVPISMIQARLRRS